MVAVYGVAARPAEAPIETEENVDGRQGWSQGRPLNAGYPAAPPVAAYPPPVNNGRPAYAYDNAFHDQVNFSLSEVHSNIASSVTNQLPNGYHPSVQNYPIRNQVSGFVQTGYQAPTGISASAAVVKN